MYRPRRLLDRLGGKLVGIKWYKREAPCKDRQYNSYSYHKYFVILGDITVKAGQGLANDGTLLSKSVNVSQSFRHLRGCGHAQVHG